MPLMEVPALQLTLKPLKRKWTDNWKIGEKRRWKGREKRKELFITLNMAALPPGIILKIKQVSGVPWKTSTKTNDILKDKIMSDFLVITRLKKKYP